MTFAIGHVEGGTNAGCKRPLKQASQAWECECDEEEGPDGPAFVKRPGYLVRCTSCKTERDARA